MTTFASLFACSQADMTYDRVRALVDEGSPESLTLEFKKEYSTTVAKSIAAMANSYGGLIVVGVADSGSNRIVGVPADAITQIANGCHERLEPPWEPEIVPVPIPDSDSTFLIVVRVDPVRAPRPIMVDGKVPIRLNGRNATADRTRVAQLFADTAPAVRTAGRRLPAPMIPTDQSGSPQADFILRTGMWVPVEEAATWRPFSERGIETLAQVLNSSPLYRQLIGWLNELRYSDFVPFRRAGFNRARHARLVWAAASRPPLPAPIEAVVEIRLPESYGVTTSTMQVTVDLCVRSRAQSGIPQPSDGPSWRLDVPTLYATIDALLETMTDAVVVAALADLASINPILVPQPGSLDFVTGTAVDDLLHAYRLTPVPDAGVSHGANLLADPSRDLGDIADRHAQIDDWLLQIALDAGLSGMQDLLVEYRGQEGHGAGEGSPAAQ